MSLFHRLSTPERRLEGLQAASQPRAVGRLLEEGALSNLPPEAAEVVAREAISGAERLREGRRLLPSQRLGLEALVRTTGRPALPVCGGTVDFAQPEARGWGHLEGYLPVLKPVIAAVGRIELAGVHIGTGFVVAPGLVLTNRHVAEAIGKAYARSGGEVWLLKAGGPVIDFLREEGAAAARRHRILRIVAAGPEPINLQVQPRRLDGALLEVAQTGEAGEALPDPVRLLTPESPMGQEAGEIVSIGYPGTPNYEPKGLEPTLQEQEVMAALKRIFGLHYGVKRFSPGEIMSRAGRVADGGKGWVFTHDATTLGGASGSCVVRCVAGKVLVVGLHFGGAWLRHNFAHLLPKLRGPLLNDSRIAWTA